MPVQRALRKGALKAVKKVVRKDALKDALKVPMPKLVKWQRKCL